MTAQISCGKTKACSTTEWSSAEEAQEVVVKHLQAVLLISIGSDTCDKGNENDLQFRQLRELNRLFAHLCRW